MSAFICSDKQFAVIAKAMFAHPRHQQTVADHLKRENIRSVNYRYGEKTRFGKVDLNAATAEDVAQYTGHDIARLLTCVDYQSCEHPDYDDIYINLLTRLLSVQGANEKAARDGLWSI